MISLEECFLKPSGKIAIRYDHCKSHTRGGFPSFEAIRQKRECEKRRKRRSIFFSLLYSIYNLTMVYCKPELLASAELNFTNSKKASRVLGSIFERFLF
jgi:hypothetical protein